MTHNAPQFLYGHGDQQLLWTLDHATFGRQEYPQQHTMPQKQWDHEALGQAEPEWWEQQQCPWLEQLPMQQEVLWNQQMTYTTQVRQCAWTRVFPAIVNTFSGIQKCSRLLKRSVTDSGQ